MTPPADPAATVFVVTARAVAGAEHAAPDGRRHDLLVFARGADEEAACAVALRGLSQLGWTDAEVLRTGEITQPNAIPADLRGAFERARAQGCALLVYDEP